jgi:hypothetical protein
MPAPSRRLVANAVATHLVGVTHAYGYYGRIGRPLPGQVLVSAGGTIPDDPPAKDPANGDMRVKAYFVLYPGGGGTGPDADMGDSTLDLTMPLPITAVAGDIEDLLALIDRIIARFDTWRPVIENVAFDRVRFPLGFTPGAALLVDDTEKPERLYARLPFQITATT